MKSLNWSGVLMIGILVSLVLAACQPPAPSPTPEPQQAQPTATPTTPPTLPPAETEGYPAPEVTSPPVSTGEGYPAPETTTSQSTPAPGIGSGYPEPGESISWVEARTLILDGQVTQLTQLHSLKVILVLEDGRSVETFEPEIDDVFEVIEECGDACDDIIVATE
jgi:hypothetical protein